MNKKFTVGLTSVLATAAFAVAPAIAQAAPAHWFENGTQIAEGTKVSITTKGSIRFKFGTNAVKCKVADEETIENPTGGGAGVDSITSITFSACLSKTLCKELVLPEITAEKTPWASTLLEGTPPKDEISGITLTLKCGAETIESGLTGTLTGAINVTKSGAGLIVFPKTGAGVLKGEKGGEMTISTGKDALIGPEKAHITAA
jgi:hypothetical protein